jgi:parallel beta-helix repeat protein
MDHDRVVDADDNCTLNYNPETDWTDINNVIHIGEQSDYDLDGTGDACDHDLDGDGIDNNFPDNCPDIPNEWQIDTDGDGYGDACDLDDDGDGVSDSIDNCMLISNQDQSDIDEDGGGDSCDQDIDGDWSYNTNDNCLSVWNLQQRDMDNDGVGNVCDSDMDGDGIDNSADNCPFDPNTNQEDQDSDGFGDACTEVHCVSDAGQFQSILSSAESNNQNDIVRLVQGTYSVRDNGNYRFQHASGEFYSIVIQGGYTTGCVSRELDPANTLLDGVINEDDNTRSNKVLDIGHSSNTVYPSWISIDDTIVKVEGVTVQNGQRGIDMYSFTGDIILQNNIIQNNGNYDWGGIRINGMEGTIMLLNNVIRNNTANYFAGAYLYTIQGSIIIANNIVTGNKATVTDGGGIYAYIIGENGLIQIINNTLTGNKAYYNGGGIYLRMNEDSAVTEIYNNIIRGNTASAGEDIYIYGSGGSVNAFFNNIGMVDGQFRYSGSNINIDPEFIDDGYWDDNGTPSYDMDDIWYEGDYHLNTGSVSIDAGINTAPSLPFVDLDGEVRPFDGDGDATAIADMGADEYTDTDRDGIADYGDNCYVTFNPEQQDTDIDGYGNACDCDLDNNGFVGSNDYTIFGQAWWSDASSQNWNADADFDSNGFIGPNDFTIFGTRWWTSMPWQ